MPAREVVLLPEAEREARAAFRWYLERNPAAAAGFQIALERAIDAVRNQPLAWSVMDETTGARRHLLRRFPYGVVYRVTEDRVTVIAVAHGRRRPGYWRRR